MFCDSKWLSCTTLFSLSEIETYSFNFSLQATDKEQELAVAKQLEYQQLEEDKLSQKSSSSKLSRSPLKIVKRPKSMQCKVTLLDGSEYACDVEVNFYFYFCIVLSLYIFYFALCSVTCIS